MKKKGMSAIVAAGLVMGAAAVYTPSAFAATNHVSVVIGGKSYNYNQVIHNNRTYVQLRSLQDAFNADVDYDGSTHTVTVSRADVVVKIDLKTNKITLNGAPIQNMPAPYLDTKANRTMVPLRAFSELFGQNVAWDGKTTTVTITPTAQQVEMENKIKQILDASNKAEASKTGMHMTIGMNVNMSGLGQTTGGKQGSSMPFPDSSNMTMKGNFDGDATVKPLAMHLKGNITVAMGAMNQSLNTEVYMQDGLMYIDDPMTHKWEKMQFMSSADWQQLTELTGTESAAQNQEAENLMLPFMRLKDNSTDNTYVVTTYLNKTLLNKLDSVAAAGTNQVALPSSDQMPSFGKLQMSLTIDKTTNLKKDIKFEIGMNAPSGETGSMDMMMDMQVDFDHVNPVTIPDDVVKNAVDMGTMGVAPSTTSPSQK